MAPGTMLSFISRGHWGLQGKRVLLHDSSVLAPTVQASRKPAPSLRWLHRGETPGRFIPCEQLAFPYILKVNFHKFQRSDFQQVLPVQDHSNSTPIHCPLQCGLNLNLKDRGCSSSQVAVPAALYICYS